MKKINFHFKKLIIPVIFLVIGLIIGWLAIYFYVNRTPTYTIQDLNQKISKTIDEKTSAYVEGLNYYKSHWENPTPDAIYDYIGAVHPELDIRLKYLKQLREKLTQEEVMKSLKK